MKFACCSDTHGKLPPAIDENGIMAWLHAGDVYDRGQFSKRPSIFFERDLKDWIDARPVPIVTVRGNHDCNFDTKMFIPERDASGKCIALAPGLLAICIGWHGEAFHDLPREFEMQQICGAVETDLVSKAVEGDQFLLLTHYPPYLSGYYGAAAPYEGWMFDCIANIVDKFKPMAIIQGHVHDLFGKQFVYRGNGFDSLVVSPGPSGGLLTIDLAVGSCSFEWSPKK